MTSSIHPDVVLVYPQYEKPPYRGGVYYTSMPLGLAYLGAILEENGLSVVCYDCNVLCPDPPTLADKVVKLGPKVVGISVTSPSLRFTKRLIEEVRGRGVTSTNPRIVVGGPHISSDPASSGFLGADAYFVGEAERAFAEYCMHPISGGAVRCGSIDDINRLPCPSRHLFDPRLYRFTTIAASRGCPFGCLYCGMAGTPYRRRSIEGIRGEIISLSAGGYAKSIDFADDVFTLGRDYALAISNLMKEYEIPWACTTRADLVDFELLAKMGDCGCVHISFGVESGDERVRVRSGKDISNERFLSAFGWCREVGVKTRAYAMVGLPGETRGTIRRTLEFISDLEADDVVYTPTIVYPNTGLMRHCLENNLVSPTAWSDYMLGGAEMPVYIPPGMSRAEINGLCFDWTKGFYLSSKHIMSRMRNAHSAEEVVDSLKAAMVYLVDPLFNGMDK